MNAPTAESSADPHLHSRLADYSTNGRVIQLTGMALIIGCISSVVAYVLIWLIARITNLAFYHRWSSEAALPQGNHLGWWVILIPVCGAILIGLMARFGSEKIRGHGIPEALEAILLSRSRIQLKVALLKPISAAISIGTGGPFGAEGPIIMTGGAFGSLFAQRFHHSASERKTLLAAGAAAGMSAIFVTPVAAVLLAVELLLFEWKPRSFIPVCAASILASVLRVFLLGQGPIFAVTPHATPIGMTLFYAALVGIAGGLLSGVVTKLVYLFEDLFQKLPIHWMWWPAIGAAFVGLGGVFEPRVLGVGYDTIHSLLRGESSGYAVLGLMLAKALVWTIALGSGTSGGVLAPLLIIGSSLGALIAPLIPAGDAGLWATIGMATLMAGTMRCPLASMLFAVELTHDYAVLPAVLIGVAGSLLVTVLLMKRSILTERLARRGHHITSEYSVDPFELSRVSEVMDKNPPTISATARISHLADRIAENDPALAGRQATLVVNKDGRLTGIITRGDVVAALQDDPAIDVTVGESASSDLIVTYPDETLSVALIKMLEKDIGRLPVVDPADPSRILGYLGRAAILSARLRFHQEEHLPLSS